MNEDSQKEAFDRISTLMDSVADQALQEALSIFPETEHVIVNDIPDVFGSKWHKKFCRVRESLVHDYQTQIGDLIKLTAHYYEYAKIFGAAQIRVIIKQESSKLHLDSPIFSMVTPEGYEKYEGWASVATENIYSTQKPLALAEKYGFSKYPKDEDLMSAQGLIWFFKAAELQQAGRQEAIDALFEAAEICGNALGCFMWAGGVESVNEEAGNSNPAVLLAKQRHAENYALAQEAIKYWKQNIDPTLSNQKAATELTKVVPLSHKTLAGLVGKAKRGEL